MTQNRSDEYKQDWSYPAIGFEPVDNMDLARREAQVVGFFVGFVLFVGGGGALLYAVLKLVTP